MTVSWDETSKAAGGWDSVSAPLIADKFGILRAPDISEEERERQRVEARKQAEKLAAERKEEAARLEAIRVEEKKAADKELREQRREERNAVRLRTLQRGFLIDQFTDTCTRMFNAVKPLAKTAVALCLVTLAAGVTYKILAADFNFHSNPVSGNQPVGPLGRGQPGNDGSGPDKKGDAGGPDRKQPIASPEGDGTPDDPNGIWGWDKYFKNGKKVNP